MDIEEVLKKLDQTDRLVINKVIIKYVITESIKKNKYMVVDMLKERLHLSDKDIEDVMKRIVLPRSFLIEPLEDYIGDEQVLATLNPDDLDRVFPLWQTVEIIDGCIDIEDSMLYLECRSYTKMTLIVVLFYMPQGSHEPIPVAKARITI